MECEVCANAIEIITSLVSGIESWASDEDGVPEGCWEAYWKAKFFIGEREGVLQCR